LVLRRWNARDAEDGSEDDRLAEQRNEARRREREAIQCEPEPEAPLEEVVLPGDPSVRNRSVLSGTKRENARRILVGGVIVEECAG
jgi:hypothetical protein